MMFELLFHYPNVLARYREGPFAEARERFLEHCADQNMAHGTLLRVARELLVIARRIDIATEQAITHLQIEAAAGRWTRHQRREGRIGGPRWSREFSVQVATSWLRFLGRLETSQPKRSAFTELIEEFSASMREERGLSTRTILARCWHVEKFLSWFGEQNPCFAQVVIEDVDAFLGLQGEHGWSRVSIATSAKALRSFFRYAQQWGWCALGIAAGITGPRLFRHEGVALGPDWSDVQHLIGSANANSAPRDICDTAILMLFAIYGFRSGGWPGCGSKT